MNDKGLQGWLKKRESGELPSGLSAAEQEELARYDRLWEAAAPPTSNFRVNTEAAWSKLDDRIFGEEKIVALDAEKSLSRPSRSRLNWLRIAAAMLVLAVAAFTIVGYLNEAPDTVLAFNTTNEIEEINLPDGSKISLNKNTALTYIGDANSRQLELTGEAFFDVAHDENRPFTITTGELTTTVLGTSFNIRAYPDEELEVSVKSGTVAVAAETEKVVLKKAEKVVYKPEAKTLAPKTEAIVDADVWKTQEFAFDGNSLRDVIPIIEDYFDIEIKVENEAILDCPVDAVFQGDNLEGILNTIGFNLSLTIDQSEEVIIFKGGECE